jgi:branched-chain amino acid transport system permease protein
MTILVQNAVFGLLIGGVYGLAAAGLALVFGVLKMLNVAHGELIMLGGYVGFWLFTIWRIDPFISIVPSALALFLAGSLLYKVLFGRLLYSPEETKLKNSILIGFGLALILQTLAIQAWTGDERAISTSYAGAVLPFDGVVVPLSRLSALAVAFLTLGGCTCFFTGPTRVRRSGPRRRTPRPPPSPGSPSPGSSSSRLDWEVRSPASRERSSA